MDPKKQKAISVIELKFQVTPEIEHKIDTKARQMGMAPEKLIMMAVAIGFDGLGINLMESFEKLEAEGGPHIEESEMDHRLGSSGWKPE